MTAFSFGAKLIEAKWKDANGFDKVSSVMEILKYADERERFMRCPAVVRFKLEQEKLDSYIAKTFKESSRSSRRSYPSALLVCELELHHASKLPCIAEMFPNVIKLAAVRRA